MLRSLILLVAIFPLGSAALAQEVLKAESPRPAAAEQMVRYKGRLMTLDEVAETQMKEARARRDQDLYREVKPLFLRLTSRSAPTRDRALERLLTIAQREARPAIAQEARQLHADTAIRHARATVTVRTQHAGPTTFTRRSIGLGGSTNPVTLELPSRSITSLRTTVGVPVGF